MLFQERSKAQEEHRRNRSEYKQFLETCGFIKVFVTYKPFFTSFPQGKWIWWFELSITFTFVPFLSLKFILCFFGAIGRYTVAQSPRCFGRWWKMFTPWKTWPLRDFPGKVFMQASYLNKMQSLVRKGATTWVQFMVIHSTQPILNGLVIQPFKGGQIWINPWIPTNCTPLEVRV